MRPSLLIADDHQMFAEALRSLLSSTCDVAGIAADGRELTELALKHKPHMILTDLSMPKLNGLDAISALTRVGLRSELLILAMHADRSIAVEVFRAGASGLVLKTAAGDELKEAVEVVQRGASYHTRPAVHSASTRSSAIAGGREVHEGSGGAIAPVDAHWRIG